MEWRLEAVNRQTESVVWRDYTTSRRTSELFMKIPKLRSSEGIVEFLVGPHMKGTRREVLDWNWPYIKTQMLRLRREDRARRRKSPRIRLRNALTDTEAAARKLTQEIIHDERIEMNPRTKKAFVSLLGYLDETSAARREAQALPF